MPRESQEEPRVQEALKRGPGEAKRSQKETQDEPKSPNETQDESQGALRDAVKNLKSAKRSPRGAPERPRRGQ